MKSQLDRVGTPSLAASATAQIASAGPWVRGLARVPNAKFTSTALVYQHAGLAADRDLRGLVDANVEFTYRYYSRMARLRHPATRRRLHASVDDAGIGPLRDALARRRGVLLASAHLGDFDVAGSWLAQVMGFQVVVILDTVTEAPRQSLFDSVRRASGLILRRRDQTRLVEVESDLRRGRVVLWMFDRAVTSTSVQGRLLGRPAIFPLAPFTLARRTGAVLICGTTRTYTDGRRVLNVSDPIDVGSHDQDSRHAVCAASRILSQHIRCCAWQWHIPAQLRQLSLTAFGPHHNPRAHEAEDVIASTARSADLSSVTLGA